MIGGVLSLAIAALVSFTLLAPWVPRMVSYSVGAMLAAAFLHLLPEAFRNAQDVDGLFATMLGGVLTFFLLEKAALWRHRHQHGAADSPGEFHHEPHNPHVAELIILGDGFHNFIDGVLIALAFIADAAIGVAATVALVSHEVPQEIGDFMVLLDCGLSRKKALILNLASSLMAVAGGIVGYYALGSAHELTPYALAFAAASFVYIAVADLMPGLHQVMDTRSTAWQIALIAAGISTVVVPQLFLHQH